MNRAHAVLIVAALPAAIFLQATLLANSLPGEVTPNLGFLLTVVAGYLWGAAGGAGTGMWAGALVGAGAGALAVPYSCLYGLVGWLSGLHKEREPYPWTWPLITAALAGILISGECFLTSLQNGCQPGLVWKFASLGWSSLAGLLFLAVGYRPTREKDR